MLVPDRTSSFSAQWQVCSGKNYILSWDDPNDHSPSGLPFPFTSPCNRYGGVPANPATSKDRACVQSMLVNATSSSGVNQRKGIVCEKSKSQLYLNYSFAVKAGNTDKTFLV